jgi:hypothetical protein
VAACAGVVGCSGGDEASPRAPTVTAPVAAIETSTEGSTETTETATVEVEVEAPASTHRQFIRRFDQICRRGNRAIARANRRLQAAFARGDNQAAARIWATSLRALGPGFYRKVKALAPPREDERGLRRYLHLSRQIGVLETRYIQALRQDDQEEMSRLSHLLERRTHQRTLVTARMGLIECGS